MFGLSSKTLIGAVLYGVGAVLTLLGNSSYGEACQHLGEMLFGIGVVHKAMKGELNPHE